MKNPGKQHFFSYRTRRTSERHAIVSGYYELAVTAVEFLAALMFLIGSILFLDPQLTTEGTWLFIVGSLFFLIRPTVKLVRELHLARLPLEEED